ncbi:hypothetical protein CMI37_26820 [Candidatus Pacearchaeota archaeon]|nr:hypothetical protein [Candidatus Pacearchaeota archaeon]|tara:strand:- start:1299 stop:1511 length:213 start_codon:yes stop_codon:yes gene_type:complete
MGKGRRLERRIGEAVELIGRYGGIDEVHHKQWVLDQVLRNLLGPEGYKEWRQEYDSEGEYEDAWDEGIAP